MPGAACGIFSQSKLAGKSASMDLAKLMFCSPGWTMPRRASYNINKGLLIVALF